MQTYAASRSTIIGQYLQLTVMTLISAPLFIPQIIHPVNELALFGCLFMLLVLAWMWRHMLLLPFTIEVLDNRRLQFHGLLRNQIIDISAIKSARWSYVRGSYLYIKHTHGTISVHGAPQRVERLLWTINSINPAAKITTDPS